MKKYFSLIVFLIMTLPNKAQTVSDIEGNIYNTITIGTQIWMKENLKTIKYNDGADIPIVTDNADWLSLTTPAYCWYDNNVSIYKATYGAMYNWYTVNTGNLCPTGWHVPSKDEWIVLYTYLGGIDIAGIKLKEAGSTHWQVNNQGDNSSGFTGLPGGRRVEVGFSTISNVGEWWSETEKNATEAEVFGLTDNEKYVSMFSRNKYSGLSLRCLKDNSTAIGDLITNGHEIIIYPNPAMDKFYIKDNFFLNANAIIFNSQGQQILNKRIDSDYIDISDLSKGLYVVKIIDSEKSIITKLIKE